MGNLHQFGTDIFSALQALATNSLFAFVLGNIAGFYIWRHLDKMHRWWASVLDKRRANRAQRIWAKYKHLAAGLQVIQTGWNNREFTEDQVVVSVERQFQLPPDMAQRTRVPHEAEWRALNLQDNPQVGLFAIDVWRKSDEPLKQSHELRLSTHTYEYFDFLATHRLLLSGTEEERAFLRQKVGVPDYLKPIQDFPTPLSVGLSLFCEGGKCLVLTRRATLASNGGLWWPSSIFNAVGENIILEKDQTSEHRGFARVSPWKTALRGLTEEMGFDESDCAAVNVHIHSFVWDTRILDYKFFGYVVSPLSRTEFEQRCWMHAADRQENHELLFLDCATRRQCADVIRKITHHQKDWASEATLCTILSLLYAKDTNWDRLV